jgi:uncharacterized lipoprotein YajG
MKTNLIILVVAVILAGCSTSNKISNSWKNPESIQQTISELAVSVKEQLVGDGLLDLAR